MTSPLTTFGAGALVGAPVRRTEDPALLRGGGTFVDNLPIEGALHLAFVRSPLAHARIAGIEVGEARGLPGVVAAYSAGDLDLPDHVGLVQVKPDMPRPALARGKVRFVGDPVAVVAAESKAQAVDAAEAVIVDYEPLDAAVDPEAALDPDAPLLFEDVGSNLVLGFREALDERNDPLAGADVVVRGRFENQRMACAPIECSAIAVIPGDQLTVYVGVQNAHQARDRIADMFGIDPAAIRVVAPHVGGSFGAKHWEPEYIAAVRIARELGRPVKWVQTRSENMVAMAQSRGQVQYVELGLRRDGTITGLRCRVVGDCGAYAGFGGMLAVGPTRTMAQGVYRIPRLAYDVAAVTTNTTPMGAYRGAGRPEAAAMLERVVDMAADELGLDPVEIRRRNLLQAGEFPYETLTGATYDSGDYDAALTEALRVAGYDDLRADQAARRARGDAVELGIGVSVYVEITAPGQTTEFAEVGVEADGGDTVVTVKVGTSAHGQGHATSYAMVVADELGVPFESIRVVQADTAAVARGSGTAGSRSMQIGGSAIVGASRTLVDEARKLAADHFEAAPDDIVLEAGRFSVAGVPARSVSWAELAAQGAAAGRPLVAEHDFAQPASSFPFGAHVSVVEVDTETGTVVPVRHVAVDDCGRIINPLLVDGQVHGGVAAGISQALWEQVVYDADGNPLTSTLADYAVPSAAELPSYELAHTETPSPLNPLGAKGIGESGTIGSTAAVQNAVVDALSHLGVRHVDLPCTPERVWRAIEQARSGTLPDPWREPPAALADLPARG